LNNREDNHSRVKSDLHLSQLASVGQIAAGIAHEVKNPLTAVKGFLHLLKENHEHPYVDIAQSELENALSTLENLLHVSKPDLEEEPFQSVNLSVELESILHLFQDQMYRIQVVRNFSDTDAFVHGKKNQLKKAFFNLLKNAFESIEGEGVIQVTHCAKDDMVTVSIRDTGVGIPEDKIGLLGTPFFTTKVEGTGMGLTQVFSVIYQHKGRIQVNSKPGKGTEFVIRIPKESQKLSRGVISLDLHYTEDMGLREFFVQNRQLFEKHLLAEAVNAKEKIEEILTIGNIDLLSNAYKLVLYIVDGHEHEMISFAKAEGVAWAKYSLTLAFKLEWVQAVRRVLWDFLYNYDRLTGKEVNREDFFALEKRMNEFVDNFLSYFFISYSHYKDDLIRKQKELVENLSVPIIPLTATMCILPLIGNLDSNRIATLADKVITHIGHYKIESFIFDLSGLFEMEADVIDRFMRILEGMNMMGCKPVITGLRPEIVKKMIGQGVSFEHKASMKGTLQQALEEYLKINL